MTISGWCWVLLAALVSCSSLALPPPYTPEKRLGAGWKLPAAEWTLTDPMLLAIRDVESSGGRDCGEGDAGERTCFQILEATAHLARCERGWDSDPDGRLAAACANRWLEKGKALCRRWDTYGQARWYNRGRCMNWKAKPTGYEQRVARARLRYLM